MREYNSGQEQSDRIYAVLQRIVIWKNAKLWRLHLRDVGRMVKLSDMQTDLELEVDRLA
jgi:hypothetical protein